MVVAAPSIEYLQEVVESQKRVINAQREKLQWYEGILCNKDLPINMRLAAIASKKLEETRKPGEDGYYRAHLPYLAEIVGVSPSTMSRGLKNLADCTEAVERLTKPDKDEPYKDIVFIRPTDLLARPQEIAPIKEIKRHGGDHRITCPTCGSDQVLEQKRYICTNPECGCVWSTSPKPANKDEESDPLQDAMGESSEEESDIMSDLPDPLQDATITVDTQVSIARCNALEELQELPIWGPWRYEKPKKPHKDGRLDKVPYNPHDVLLRAKVNDATTWGTYEQAKALYDQSRNWHKPFDGIGFMCNGDYTGVDLDHCRNKETGEISQEVQAIIDRINSFTYITPSEEGVRIVTRAKKAGDRCKWGNIELYDHERFFTWTGNHLAGTPETIEECQAEIDALYAELAPASQYQQNVDFRAGAKSTCSCSDVEILEKARNARNGSGAKFRALYDDGNTAGYPSHSEADLALCVLLAYWSDGCVSTINRLFEHSGLMSEKWERADYRERTINKALELWQLRRAS